MCYGTDAAAPARKQRAAEAGALEAVLAAMRTHPQVYMHMHMHMHMRCACGVRAVYLRWPYPSQASRIPPPPPTALGRNPQPSTLEPTPSARSPRPYSCIELSPTVSKYR